jgi:hypothetical protein
MKSVTTILILVSALTFATAANARPHGHANAATKTHAAAPRAARAAQHTQNINKGGNAVRSAALSSNRVGVRGNKAKCNNGAYDSHGLCSVHGG